MLIVNTSASIASLPVCDDKWHSVSAVFSGAGATQTVATYIDGASVASSSFGVAMTGSTASPLVIGASGEAAPNENQYVGAVSDLRVYARALSAAEAGALGAPFLPLSAGGTTVPPPGSPGTAQYKFQCLPGWAGPNNETATRQAADNSWVYSGGVGATSCSMCPAQSFPAAVAGGTACAACSTISANAVANAPASPYCVCRDNFMQTGAGAAISACTACPDGSTSTGGNLSCACSANFLPLGSGASMQCLCPAGFATSGTGPTKQCFTPCAPGTYSLVSGGACTACPANSVSGADARTCTCGANSTSNGLSGAALVCRACPSNAVGLGGASACQCIGFWDVYDPVSNVCNTPPSATASVTPSATPSPTSTVSVTASITPSTTPSLTRTGSQTASVTPSITASQSATTSPTPSVTPVPDVLITFAFTIAAAGGGSLQPRDLAGSASVINSICFNYAQLLQVPQAQVSVANFTDIATGAVVAASQVPRVRRLAAAAGSQGVSVSVVVALGKTPTEQRTVDLNAALGSAGSPAMVALQASITQAVASNARAPASAFSTGAPASVSFVGSPFISSAVVVAAAGSSASAAPAAGGAAAGGIVGAVLLACAVWSYRSWSKHGELPCCRNRKREELFKKASAAESVEVTSAIAEAENALGGAAAGPGMGGSSKALIVKRLVEKAARDAAKAKEAEASAAEVVKLREELAKAKRGEDADEIAELRAQLRAAKAAQAEAAAAAPPPPPAAGREAFAPIGM